VKKILERIQDASFTTEWLLENQAGAPRFKTVRKQNDDHAIEEVGKRIRALMPWLDAQE